MDTVAINIPASTPVTTTAASTASQSTTAAADTSFAKMLASLANASTSTTKTASVQQDSSGQNLTWRDIQGMLQAGHTGASEQTNGLFSADDGLTDLVSLFKQLGSMESADQETLLAIIDRMQKKLQQTVSEQGQEVAGQQLMDLLAMMMQNSQTNLSAMSQMQAGTSYETQLLLASVLTASPQEAMQLITSQDQTLSAQVMSQLTASTSTQSATASASAAPLETFAVEKGSGAGSTETPIVMEATSEKAGDTAQSPMQFDNAVRAAKEQLAKSEGKTSGAKQETDVDALQKQVDSGAYLRNTPLAGTNQVEAENKEVEVPTLRTQVEDGILTGIKAGQEQFNIKLNPEGLGELTIRLTKTTEGMNLSIIAKNAETAKLLTNELDLLRNNLQPMKVEVDSILTSQQEQLLSGQQNFEQQRQQFQWQNMKGAAYYGDKPLGDATEQQTVPSIAPSTRSISTALDTYI